jgi:hypothetical protein
MFSLQVRGSGPTAVDTTASGGKMSNMGKEYVYMR